MFQAAEQTELTDFAANIITAPPLIDEEAEILSGEVDELEGGTSSRIVMNRSKATKSIVQKTKPKVVNRGHVISSFNQTLSKVKF